MIKPCGHKTGANSWLYVGKAVIQHAANQSPCTTGDVLEGTVYCAINTRLMSQNTMTGVGGCGGYTQNAKPNRISADRCTNMSSTHVWSANQMPYFVC